MDDAVIEQILSHETDLRTHALKLTKNYADMEDLVQETLIKAITKKDLYEPKKGRLLNWLYTIQSRLHIDTHRGNAKRHRDTIPMSSLTEDPLWDILEEFSYIDGQKELELRELSQRLTEVIDSLPEPNARTFIAVLKGELFGSLAKEDGVALNTISNRFRRAKELAMQHITGRGYKVVV